MNTVEAREPIIDCTHGWRHRLIMMTLF